MDNGRAYEAEVDLRDYLEILWRRRLFVVVPLIVAVIAGALFSYVPGEQYEATSYLLITRPPQVFQFDPRLPNQEILPSGKVYSILAKSPEVLAKVVDKVGDQVPPHLRSSGAVEGLVILSNREDPSLVKITARHADPKVAMVVANAYVQAAGEVVGEAYNQIVANEKRMGESAKLAETGLAAADRALIDFERVSPITSLQAQVTAAQYREQQLYFARNAIDLTLRDADRVRQQLVASNGNSVAASVNEVLLQTLLLRFADVRGQLAPANPLDPSLQPQGNRPSAPPAQPAPAPGAPVQLQLALDRALAATVPLDERLRNLDTFVGLLRAERDELGRTIQAESATLQDAKRQLVEQSAQEERLKLERDTARTSLITIRNKLDESRFAVQAALPAAKVASLATPPPDPVSRRVPLNLGVAAAIGLAVGLLLAFAIEYLTAERRPAPGAFRRYGAPDLGGRGKSQPARARESELVAARENGLPAHRDRPPAGVRENGAPGRREGAPNGPRDGGAERRRDGGDGGRRDGGPDRRQGQRGR
ncbi:MAG: hypothetical protein HY329_03860 [Chloroflexi bacterium]|nr:hypothetical protein [Chloroflexota bacterium]